MLEIKELRTLSPKKWLLNLYGAKPTIDVDYTGEGKGCYIGDYVIDISQDPVIVWRCIKQDAGDSDFVVVNSLVTVSALDTTPSTLDEKLQNHTLAVNSILIETPVSGDYGLKLELRGLYADTTASGIVMAESSSNIEISVDVKNSIEIDNNKIQLLNDSTGIADYSYYGKLDGAEPGWQEGEEINIVTDMSFNPSTKEFTYTAQPARVLFLNGSPSTVVWATGTDCSA